MSVKSVLNQLILLFSHVGLLQGDDGWINGEKVAYIIDLGKFDMRKVIMAKAILLYFVTSEVRTISI